MADSSYRTNQSSHGQSYSSSSSYQSNNPSTISSYSSSSSSSLSPSPPIDASHSKITSARFNQTFSCIGIATSGGYKILNCEPFEKCYEDTDGGISLIEMLFCTSLLCLVGSGSHASFSPRRLRLFNSSTSLSLCELNFITTVLNVRMCHSRLVVVLESKIHIFDLASMAILHTLDTPINSGGLCALSSESKDRPYMCYPANADKGEVFVYDVSNLSVVGCIRAHTTPIRCASFNANGSMLATASMQGTVLRVFAIPSGKKLFTFRRGTYAAVINAIQFSKDGEMIVVSSEDSSTVHVFSMREPAPAPVPPPSITAVNRSRSPPISPRPSFLQSSNSSASATLSAASNLISSISSSSALSLARVGARAAASAGVSSALGLLPATVADLVEPPRNFASIALRDGATPRAVAFDADGRVMVVTSSGYFHVYKVPLNGGSCKLESEHSLMEKRSEEVRVRVIGTEIRGGGGGQNGSNGGSNNGSGNTNNSNRNGNASNGNGANGGSHSNHNGTQQQSQQQHQQQRSGFYND